MTLRLDSRLLISGCNKVSDNAFSRGYTAVFIGFSDKGTVRSLSYVSRKMYSSEAGLKLFNTRREPQSG